MPNGPPSAWASALIQRLANLEQQLQTSPLASHDPNVLMRTPGAGFTASVDMLYEFPYVEEDFFKRPLEETDRRRFLFDCSKNTVHHYDPLKLNKVPLSGLHCQFDAQLSNLQYRLSGITRPSDWFAY